MSEKNRISRVFYFEGLTLGLLLSSLLYSAFELLRLSENYEKLQSSPAFIVVPAFLAAYLTLRGIAEQARNSQNMEIERYQRSERAARAELPVALSSLKQLCNRVLKWHFDTSEGLPAWEEFAQPLRGLRGTVEYADEANGEYLLKIFRHYQILYARGQELDDAQVKAANKFPKDIIHYDHWNSAKDWAVLGALVENVLAYARGQTDIIPNEPVNERVWSQFFLIVFVWDNYPVLRDLMERRSNENNFERSFSGWENH